MLIIPATLVSLLVFRDVKLLVVLAIYYGYRCAARTTHCCHHPHACPEAALSDRLTTS